MSLESLPPEILKALREGGLANRRRRHPGPPMKPWEERPARARAKLTSSLNTFQSWRRESGELLPSDPWNAPPPTPQQVADYLQTLKGRSPSWRTYTVQALRMYLIHVGKPELADMVVLPRAVKGA